MSKRKGKQHKCPTCGATCRTRERLVRHMEASHGYEHEETFAERAVQAEIDRACGIDNPDIDWLLP